MTITKKTKRFISGTDGAYTFAIRDYGYKSRAPVGVSVIGTTLGECKNPSGEPCYFYQPADAFSLREGLERAAYIIAKQARRPVQIPR